LYRPCFRNDMNWLVRPLCDVAAVGRVVRRFATVQLRELGKDRRDISISY
jgi:hypothetical protein